MHQRPGHLGNFIAAYRLPRRYDDMDTFVHGRPNAFPIEQPTRLAYPTTGFGDLGRREVPESPADRVAMVISLFRTKGTEAGLKAARAAGIEPGAKLYLAIRAETESELAARLARLRVETRGVRLYDGRVPFVEARLEEVRASLRNGATPPQAVADKPEVPIHGIPKWVSYGGFAIGLVALIRSFSGGR